MVTQQELRQQGLSQRLQRQVESERQKRIELQRRNIESQKQKNISQQEQLKSRIKELQNEIDKYKGVKGYEAQTKFKQIRNEKEILGKALNTLKEGGTYTNVSKIITSAREYGETSVKKRYHRTKRPTRETIKVTETPPTIKSVTGQVKEQKDFFSIMGIEDTRPEFVKEIEKRAEKSQEVKTPIKTSFDITTGTVIGKQSFDIAKYGEIEGKKVVPKIEKVKEVVRRDIETFKRGVSTLAEKTKVGEIPTPIKRRKFDETRLSTVKYKTDKGDVTSIKRKKFLTLGEVGAGVGKFVSQFWKEGEKATEKTIKQISKETGLKLTKTIPEKEIPLYQRATIIDSKGFSGKIIIPEKETSTLLGYTPKVIGKGETLMWFTPATFPLMVGTTFFEGTEEKRKAGQLTKEQISKQFKEYSKQDVEEGYRLLTKEEFSKEYSNEIKSQIISQAETKMALSVGLGLGVGGFKAVSGLRKPQIKLRDFEKIGKTQRKFIEIKQPIRVGEDVTSISRFRIVESRAGVKGQLEVTSELRNVLGMKGKKLPKDITLPKQFAISGDRRIIRFVKEPTFKITEPLGSIIGKKPFVSRTYRVLKSGELGKPKISFVGGKQEPIELQELLKLKVPKYQLEQLLSKTKTRLIKDEGLSLGRVVESDISKQIGKMTKRSQVISIVKDMETKGVKVFDVKTSFKGIDKPLPRARGRIDIMIGKVVELPIMDLTPEKMRIKVGGTTKKTTLQPTFQETIQATRVIPKVPKPKPFKNILDVKPDVKVELPTMVGGTGLTIIPREATMTYEVSESMVGIQPKISSKTMLDLGTQPRIKEKQLDIQVSETKLITLEKPIQKEVTKLGFRQQPLEKPSQKVKLLEKVKQIELLKTKQTQTQIQREILRTTTTPKRFPKPKIPTTKFPRISLLKKLAKKVRKEPELFEAIGIRFGKEVSLGKGTKEKVKLELKSFLKGTLGASGFLKERGRKLKAEETNLLETFGFRKSKKSPFLIVEKKERRLKKGTQEVPEIQYFKKKSKKSKFGL